MQIIILIASIISVIINLINFLDKFFKNRPIKKRRAKLIKVLKEWYKISKDANKRTYIDDGDDYTGAPNEWIEFETPSTIKKLLENNKIYLLEKIMDICVKKLKLFNFDNDNKIIFQTIAC